MSLKVGERAPEFTLPSINGKDVSLSDFKGQRILLSFHPLAFTSICGDQVRDLAVHFNDLKEKGIDAVLSISVDPAPAKKVWAMSLDINPEEIIFLSDFEPKGEVAKKYDAYIEDWGMSGRNTYVIDGDGMIEIAIDNDPGQLPDLESLIEKL
ncbi:redoxin domain-containing protein [Dolosicoccus paucivorans]|uniref:Peroxiredoxin n=1 Tax=Dolosicoccus paucivorans TaxID=84521 RepID=A0A1G8N2A9_9LACT|nr:redoxin domain-containing protein [Dolosicoccus paucivorans]PMB84362.1 peroxiredoxin [Dolosicoccus paucivorans]PMC58111.1 peroxiredoxin [Dolosicoccus paucivorans]SDI74411.1 Peroxiredoxin [Dolosicoccus paucivorans]